MTDKTEAIRRAREVVALLEHEGNAKAADSVRAVIQELVYMNGLAKEYHGKLSEYVQHFDQKEEELRQREAQLSARQAAPDGWRLVPELPTLNMLNTAFGICIENGRPVQQMIEAAAGKYAAMLSAAPPQPEREPLTDEQIDDLCGEANRGFDIERDHYRKAFRDGERAHGIGAANDNP